MSPLLSCRAVTAHLPHHEEGGGLWLTRACIHLHLAACRDCGRYLAQLRAVRGALAALGGASASGPDSPRPVPPETKALLSARFRAWRARGPNGSPGGG